MSTPENKLEDQELEKQEIIDHESESQTQQTDKEQDAQTEKEQDTAAETPLSEEEQLKKSLANEQDKFLRLFAEFENYKKRTSKERMDLFKTANQEVIVAMLPVVDDFERALKELSKDESSDLFKGVSLIQNKFWGVLKNKGLEEVAVKAGDVFDSELHDAITQIPAPDKKMKGKIIDVIEKGFQLGDKIIRHPKVVVGN
ncbi:MAG: nucleotide exchange factor GrpE [Flavobacteriaceae bacterium]|jgi:molecular chaperone GrpE|nr:nucleotide exchange factor GrpE [Flavobacteriaceae bacterium]MCI5087697.1 nucleotide exchange factor GrpE [Flavobacteriaceae bacterium]CAI8203723.1 MAG: Protein GrpE [SAR116 cluster bacterium]